MKQTFYDDLCTIDLETLGVGSDAVILSLGLVVSRYDEANLTFDHLKETGLSLKFDIKEQLARGRKTSKRVVAWWYEQDSAAKNILAPKPDDISLYDLDSCLQSYFKRIEVPINKVDMYDRNCFDLSKLQYLYEEELNSDVPWDYNHTFDIPTALRFLGSDRYGGVHVSDFPGAIYHRAIDDAAVDHMRMLKVINADVARK